MTFYMILEILPLFLLIITNIRAMSVRICETEPRKSIKRAISSSKINFDRRLNQIQSNNHPQSIPSCLSHHRMFREQQAYLQRPREQEIKFKQENRIEEIGCDDNEGKILPREPNNYEFRRRGANLHLGKEILPIIPNNWGFIVQLALGVCFLIAILLMVSTKFEVSCTESYKEQKCWESSKSMNPTCIKLAKCIESQQDFPYREQIMASLAGLAFVIRKYWREIIEMIPKIVRR